MVFFKMPLTYLRNAERAYQEQVYHHSEEINEALITGYEQMAALNREYSEFGFFVDADGMKTYEDCILDDEWNEN